MVFLDTDVLIDFLRNNKEVVKKINNLREKDENLSTTSINSFELYRGSKRLSGDSEEEAAETLLRTLKLFDFTLEDSKKAAEIFETLKSKGEIIELTDIMIAAIAIENNQTLLTRNTKHFEKIKDLKLEAL